MPRSSLAKVATDALKKELQRRLEALPKLIAQRDELNCRIAELEASGAVEEAPRAHEGACAQEAGTEPKYAKSAVSLASTLAEVIKTKDSMSIAEAVEGALASGYKSKSKDFPNVVSMTLANDKRFGRVARGIYRLKS